MPSPLISVIIPAYNAVAFLPQTLRSVLAQSWRDFELIVVDDGSQDGTLALLQKVAAEDARLKVLTQANQGVAVARNTAIAAAQGEWIAPIDADDRWEVNYLQQMVAQIQASPQNVGVLYAWSLDIDAADQPTGGFHAAKVSGYVYPTLVCHNFLGNASATVIRRQALSIVGGYDHTMRDQQAQGCEDWDLYLRLAAKYAFAVVPDFLVGYRKLANSMSGDGRTMAKSQDILLKRVELTHPEIPPWYRALSRSSFYLYLAHQSAAQGESTVTLVWIKRALQADWITPWLRPSTYALVLRSAPVLRSWQAGHARDNRSPRGRDDLAIPVTPNRSPLVVSAGKLWLKVTIVAILHRCLTPSQRRLQPTQWSSEVD
jgi:glycosyltransferase involved in cell wall biosynthesis